MAIPRMEGNMDRNGVILSDWNKVEGVEGSTPYRISLPERFFDSLRSLRMTCRYVVPFDGGIATGLRPSQ